MSHSPVQTYNELLHAIRDVQTLSQKRLDQAINQEKVREVWETGKLIDAHVLQFKERADYGREVLKRLARDLGTSDTELGFCLQFVRAYPIYPHAGKLTWSDYRDILSLNDPKDRKEVEDEAVRGNWNRDQIREEVRRRQSRSVRAEKFPAAVPGKIYTYRVVKSIEGPYSGQLVLDLGFSTYFLPDGISQFKEGDIVTIHPEIASSAFGLLAMTSPNEELLFTYNAYVTQIIDGDTFHVLVDLGFKIFTEQKLRLRGLDAPEVQSADGRDAKAFLQKKIPTNGTPTLIRTVKSDKYDRYLADVWLPLRSDKASSGGAQTTRDEQWTLLNQELIDNGLALRVRE